MHLTRSPGGLLLSVQVDDVLHQQVPRQAEDSVAVQHHLVTARRTAKPTATEGAAGGPAGLPQRVGCLDEEKVRKCFRSFSHVAAHIERHQC